MSVMRFDPFSEPFRQMDRLASQLLSGARMPMGMPMDVWESEDGYHVALDLPGMDPESVEITCERNMLLIRAERQADYGEDQSVLVAERPQGSFTRQLHLGDGVDSEHVRAEYHEGVLRLTVPRTQSAQPRRIEVQTSSRVAVDS
jgi:HSP20 family protein